MSGKSLQNALAEMNDRRPQSSRDLANWGERLTMAAFDDASHNAATTDRKAKT